MFLPGVNGFETALNSFVTKKIRFLRKTMDVDFAAHTADGIANNNPHVSQFTGKLKIAWGSKIENKDIFI